MLALAQLHWKMRSDKNRHVAGASFCSTGRKRSWSAALTYHGAMSFDQIAIALLGALAAWLSQARGESSRKWAPVFGMLGQPFWFYASWQAGQWGIFAVSIVYACAWSRGLWVYWISPRRAGGSGLIQLVPGWKR